MENKKIVIILLIFTLIATLMGGTFAYLSWQANNSDRTLVTFTTTKAFSCSANGGGNINTNNVTFAPVDSKKCNSSEYVLKRKLTFNVTKKNKENVKLNSWLNINNLGSYLRGNSNFKWVVSSEESCSKGIVSSGDFGSITTESSKIEIFNDVYDKTTSGDYYLYMWLDKAETRIPDSDVSTRTFDLSLDGECSESTVSVLGDIKEIANYQNTPIPVTIKNNNNYPVTVSISFKETSLLKDMEISANSTVNHDVYLSAEAYKAGETEATNYLSISVNDNNQIIKYNSIVGFTKPYHYLKQANEVNFITTVNSNIAATAIKTITFMDNNVAPVSETRTLVGSFDVSADSSGTIMAYYYETETSGQYDFYIGSSDGVVYANPYSDYTFYSLTNLTDISGMEYFDISNVTSMNQMFCNCSSLTALDVSSFDTSKVINMRSMFYNCSSLTILDVSHFDTSNVTSMRSMFYNCGSLTTLDVSHFDTSNVTSMRVMFYNCSSLTTLNLSNFDTSKVTDMNQMFTGCEKLTFLDVSHFDTSKVTDMRSMFNGCIGLTTLDVSHFDTSNVIDMSYMFCNCRSLTTLDLSHFDTSKVTDMSSMFYYCSSLTTLDLSSFDTSKVTNMGYMFYDCSSLTTLNVSSFDTSKVTDMSYMFFKCSNITTIDVSNFNTSKVIDMSFMFAGYSSSFSMKLTSIIGLNNFDTSNVTNMQAMFQRCSSLTTLDVSHFDTSKVTDMSYMFCNCNKLTTLNIKGFTFDSVTSYGSMFTSVPTTVKITVGNETAKTWLNTNFSSYTNIVIG